MLPTLTVVRPAHLPPLQVQDDIGRGVPVGFMVCSSDTVEVVHRFLEALQQGVSAGMLSAGVLVPCSTAGSCCAQHA